jgi:hypothetical protein
MFMIRAVGLVCASHENLCVIKRLGETVTIERFRQIVDCVYVKSAHRMLVVCSYENDDGHALDSETMQNVEPVHVGHLHVQKNEVGSECRNRIHRLCSISRLTDNLHLAIVLQHFAYSFAREWLVINN